MIEETRGNLLSADAEALVNTVNCVGVMGKGVALQFKQAYPEMARAYAKACEREELQPGRTLVWHTGQLKNPRCIINFPTKKHWIGKSRYEYIESGLEALVEQVRSLGIRSIAVPPLGCGNGGLDWAKVRPMIERAFSSVPDVRVLLYAPAGAPQTAERIVRTNRPKMTRARALFLLAMDRYAVLAYETSQLEIQKLAFFLQESGEKLRLNFVAHKYGPYAENLNKVLEDMEGHLISGYDGDRSPETVITLREGAKEEAAAFLKDDQDAHERMGRLTRLIEGFETPYGMELLATVQWVGAHADPVARDASEAVERVRAWSKRKAADFQPEHVRTAWDRLRSQGWLPAVGAV